MEKLKIIEALYYDSNNIKQGYNITKELTQMVDIDNNRLFYNGSYNDIFGDPAKRIKKRLKIILEFSGSRYTKVYKEDEKINLPKDLNIETDEKIVEDSQLVEINDGSFCWGFLKIKTKNIINRYFKDKNGKIKKVFLLFFLVVIILVSVIIWTLIKPKRSFNFNSYGTAWGAESAKAPTTVEAFFDGNVRNNSNENRTLEKIHYVVWKNRKLGSVYNYGWHLGDKDLYEYEAGDKKQPITLPLFFRENESKRLGIGFDINVDTEEEMKVWSQQECKGVFCWAKSDILEILFEDSKGNLFDKEGKLMSSKVIDLWWILPNYKKFPDLLIARLNLYKEIGVWKFKQLFYIVK